VLCSPPLFQLHCQADALMWNLTLFKSSGSLSLARHRLLSVYRGLWPHTNFVAYELARPCLLGHSCSPASLWADYRVFPRHFFLSTGSHDCSTIRLRPIPWLWITQCSHYVTILDLDDSIWLHAAPEPSISLARLELPGFFLEGFPSV